MKRLLLISLLCILAKLASFAQEVNYPSLKRTTNHLVSASLGADYSIYYGLSYGYIIKTKWRPVVIGTEFSLPFGKDKLDDWKWAVSAQTEVLNYSHFSLALKPSFIVRQYDSPLARMSNISGAMSLTAGYVKPQWGLVALGSYDRAFATHVENGLLKEYYPQIQDGWYNSSGGNFKFGVRAHFSIKSWNTFLALGKTFGQDFRDNPTLPFFMELSIQKALVK